MLRNKLSSKEISKIFTQSLSCSQTMITVVDRAMGHVDTLHENAAHPLAGGLMRLGYQCGMIWGATLAAGAEAARLFGTGHKAECAAIIAARQLIQSFESRAGHVNCRDMTKVDFKTFIGRVKYMITGKAVDCAKLAVRWAPSAIKTIDDAFDGFQAEQVQGEDGAPVSCASLVASKMGASDEEAVMAAGFAGGVGLSGGACGAFAAASWMTTLKWFREHPQFNESFTRAMLQEIIDGMDFNPANENLKEKFLKASGDKYTCREIVGRLFENFGDHAAYVRGGGCADILTALAG